MLVYDRAKRPTFKELLDLFNGLKSQMQAEFDKKYDSVEGIEQ
jgi:hypothetical protein